MHPRDYLVSGLFLTAAALTSGCATSSVLDSGEDGAAAGGTSQRGMLADPGLESAMRTALNQPQGLLDTAAFLSLRELDAAGLGIKNLQGIGIAANLRRLVLDYNQLSDLAPLASLVHLRYLELSQNRIQDILSLAHLGALEILDLSANQIEDVAPLADLENLTHLDLDSNEIEDLSPLVGLGNLSVLNLDNNKVHDISSLFGLRRLRNLELSGNPLSDPEHIQQLRQQSVEVHFYIPSVILGDIRLEAAIRRAVDKQEGDLVEDDLLAVRSLLITGAVHSLEGIQGLRNLESLTLHGINSTLADISPLAQVQNLRTVSLNSTWLRHLGPLADLARLEDLDTRDLVAERRESHALYGVGEGQGTRVRLFGSGGALVGEIVGGKIRGQDIQDLRRFSMAFYFRRGDGDEVYLTPTFFSPSADPSSWVAGRLFEALDAEAIDRMERLDATGEDSWSLVRVPQPAEADGEDDLAPDAPVWTFERPTDRGSVDSSKASSLAWTLTGFGIKDVLGKCDPQKGPGSAFGFPSDVFLAGAGEDSLELRWGVSAEEGGGRPLWIPGQPWIFELAKFDVDRILASVADLLPPPPQE